MENSIVSNRLKYILIVRSELDLTELDRITI